MKFTNKRLVSILLCLAMVLAILPVAAFAADTTTVYYYNATNWDSVSVYWWGSAASNPGWPGNVMTDLGNGYWSYEIPSDLLGKEGVIFNNANGAQTSNLTAPTDGKNCFTGSEWIEYTGEEIEVDIDYYLRGDMNGWDTSCQMVETADGIFTYTMDLAAGTYEYKAAIADWSWSVPAENATMTLDEAATVIFTLDVAANTISWEIAPKSSAPEALVLGDNAYEIVAGDINALSSTYTATEAGILVVNVSAMSSFDEYAGEWSEVPSQYIGMQFGRMYALTVNGNPVYGMPGEIEVAVGDKVEVAVQSFMGTATKLSINLSIREPGVNDVKWQLTAGTSANSNITDLRLISWVDSLDYSSVAFNVSVDGVPMDALVVEKVYTAINENGDPISASDLFGDQAAYIVTYVISEIPASAFDSEFEVSVTWTDLEGYETTSETRAFAISDKL